MRKKECSFKGITTLHEVEDEEESGEDSQYSQDSPDYQEIDELLNFSKNIVESMSKTETEICSNSPPSTPKEVKCFDSAFSSFSDNSSIFDSESIKNKSIARSSAALELERETRENLSDSLDSITSISLESPINFEYKPSGCIHPCCRKNNSIFSNAVEEAKQTCESVRSGLAKLMSVLEVEISSNASISAETERLLAKIDERERNIENLKSELHFI